MSLLGQLLQRRVLNATLGKDPLPSLVVTFGLSIMVQNLLLELFSADPRSMETNGFNTESWSLSCAALSARWTSPEDVAPRPGCLI